MNLFGGYRGLPGVWDELFDGEGKPRPGFGRAIDALDSRTALEFGRCQTLAERALLNQGVTFSVYNDDRGTEKIFPVCLLPRLISAEEWRKVEEGLLQRLRALSMFLDDVYGEQRILAEGRVPRELVLRTPSGVSYVLENRVVTKRVMPRTVDVARVQRVEDYPARLAETLVSVSPVSPEASTIVVLTPGPYNSAYFEHSFLARTMGLELVEAADLFVDDDRVWLRTTSGPRRVHVVYRRTDEAFLDPEVFRKDSMLGVPGIMRAWAKGNVALANAPGNGVADDKAIYAYVPEMVRFYLAEEPLLGQVRTWVCFREDDRQYVLEHLAEMVVKAVDEAGGYGMLIGPQASAAERDAFRAKIQADPRRYVAQRLIELSTCPTWDKVSGHVVPRRVDLRPYSLFGKNGAWVLPGGLTRVALVEGSYVVNSSQGGGSKDTWVMKP